jgi:hypothetical protein
MREGRVQEAGRRSNGGGFADRRARNPAAKSPAACGIAVMAKASSPGRTKTRLVPPLSYQQAAALNTAFLRDVAQNILAAARRSSIAGYMAFGPPGGEQFFKSSIDPDIDLFEAWLPNFGDCLQLAVRELLARGHQGGIVLNSDSPTLPTALLIEAADILAQPGDRVVLGPAVDGGYYLLGIKYAHPRLFADIAWSTSRVAAQTMDRARELGLHVHVLARWYDVDDADALSVLHAELTGRRPFDAAIEHYHAPHTAELMRTLFQDVALPDPLGAPALEGAAP